MRNAGLEETHAGIKIAGRNINNLRYADDTTLMAENEEELKSLLMKVKSESELAHTGGEHRGSRHHLICAPSPLLIETGGSIPLRCLQGLGGTRRVGGLLGVAGRLSGTVSPFRAEQGTSLAHRTDRRRTCF